MSKADCQLEIPPVKGLSDTPINVGRHINLNCASTDIEPNFSFKDAHFKTDESTVNNLKVFSVKPSDGGKFSIDFTFYTVGKHQINQMILTDGVNEINLSALSEVNVETVIKPDAEGKPPEPFGAILPITISTPAYYFIILLAVVISAIIFFIFRFKRIAYYRNLKSKLKMYASPVEPDMQFYKSIRLSEKINYPIDKLEAAFKLYNLRAYQIPIFDLPNDRAMKYFKRNYPQYKNTRLVLHKLLGEFEELHKKSKNLTLEEKREFVKKLYRYVESHKGINP
ncbi:MAG: hypothetical protein ABL930_03520 [Pseudobdellovibrio sp.]